MPPEQENAVKIAVLEERIDGLREQQKAHHCDTKNDLAEVKETLVEMAKRQDELTAIMNRGKGAYAASMAMASSLGALAITVITWLLDAFNKR